MAILVNKNAPPMLFAISISGGSGKHSIHFKDIFLDSNEMRMIPYP